jgi:hypothetical protein
MLLGASGPGIDDDRIVIFAGMLLSVPACHDALCFISSSGPLI